MSNHPFSMARYIEELARQHLWHWLENQMGYTVDAEVKTDVGRVDLVAREENGDVVGIEVKPKIHFESNSTVSEQIDRYIGTKKFDRFYLASPYTKNLENVFESEMSVSIPVVREACYSLGSGVEQGRYKRSEVMNNIRENLSDKFLNHEIGGNRTVEDYIDRKIDFDRDNESVSIEEGVRQIKSATMSERIGLIHVPLTIDGKEIENPRRDLKPSEIIEPEVVLEAENIESRDSGVRFNRTGEPWVRHHVWKKVGGIPEGHIPNTKDSDTSDRPVDIIAYENTFDPTQVLRKSSSAEVVAVEAKGKEGVKSERTKRQLKQFIETDTLSRLYLAVPESSKSSAVEILQSSQTTKSVGIITVDRKGNTEILDEAGEMEVRFDGYKKQGNKHRIGYGEISVSDGEEVEKPFSLRKWRDNPVDNDGNPVSWSLNPVKFAQPVKDTKQYERQETREMLKQYGDQEKHRSYLLQGISASPSAQNKEKIQKPKRGYTRLTLSSFETSQGELGLELHFGRGSYEGGYIRLVEEEASLMVSAVANALENTRNKESNIALLGKIAKLAGQQDDGENIRLKFQGRAIDLNSFKSGSKEHKLSGSSPKSESLLNLTISTFERDNDTGVRLNLCDEEKRGVNLVMTEVQAVDLLKCIRIARYGRNNQIPNEGSYKRIGPSGSDTWDKGTGIEKVHRRDFEIEL